MDARVFPGLAELGAAAAGWLATAMADAVRARGRCSVALSGGTTPRGIFEQLATRFRDRVPWREVHLFWGDERYVPHDDPRSNYRMARESLIDRVPCPPANVRPMPTGLPSADEAARRYEETMKEYFAGEWPVFDVLLLGLGADGHTASLFPGSPALEERARWVIAVEGPADPPTRLTLTLPVLQRAARVSLLVAGADKAPAVRRLLAGPVDPAELPASAVVAEARSVTLWLDAAAAGGRAPRSAEGKT